MKRRVFVAIAGLAAVAPLWLAIDMRSDDATAEARRANVQATAAAHAPGQDLTAAPRASQLVQPRAPRFRVGDTFYGIQTQAEADWRQRNLYPTPEELNAAATRWTARDIEGPLTPALLARAERVALLDPALRASAVARLQEAAALGSIYALEALVNIHQFQRRDPATAEAYARVAAMRGDWRPRITTYTLDDVDRMRAELLAQKLMRDLERERRRRGLPPFTRDPPPGLDEVLEASRTWLEGGPPPR